MPITLDELALGYLERAVPGPGMTARLIGVANVSAIPRAVRDYLIAQAEDVANRSDEYGRAQKGWWNGGAPPSEIQNLLPGATIPFQDGAAAAVTRLGDVTPGTAKAGLIAIMRISNESTHSLTVLKLEVDETEFYRFTAASQAEAAIAYQRLEDVLPAEGSLHKAALIPHPTDPSADARVLDQNYGDETARYWLAFLGVRVVPPLTRIASVTLDYAQDALGTRVGDRTAREAMEATLTEIAQGQQPTSPRDIVNRVAERSGVPPGEVWADVSSRTEGIFGADTSIAVSTLQRVQTVISFRVRGQRVMVRGPADALSGRYRWQAVPGGYQLTITTDDEPEAKRVLKTG